MQPDAAVRADHTLGAVESENLHAYIFLPAASSWRGDGYL
jgi:hypothetical protein